MNPLPCLAFAAFAATGLVAWQQEAINRVQAEIKRLSDEVVAVRAATEADQSSLAEARARVKQVQAEMRGWREDEALFAAYERSMPGPAEEGWWPEEQPYFYMPKAVLPNVRFRHRQMTPEEMRAWLKTQFGSDGIPAEIEAALAEEFGQEPINVAYPLLQEGHLNRDMAMLLGMNAQEWISVNEIYSELIHDVRATEAARIQFLDPPEQLDDGRMLVARLPAILPDVAPLVEQYTQGLEQLLGESRAEILVRHAQDYFNEHMDGLGSVERDFLQRGPSLGVRYHGAGHHWFLNKTFHLDSHHPYRHLLEPGRPSEWK